MRFQKEEMAAMAALLCALAAISILYLMPGSAGYANFQADSKEGDGVSVTGAIVHLEITRTGGHVKMAVAGDDGHVKLFIPAGSNGHGISKDLHEGDHIRAEGKVTVYNGEKEVMVDRIKKV